MNSAALSVPIGQLASYGQFRHSGTRLLCLPLSNLLISGTKARAFAEFTEARDLLNLAEIGEIRLAVAEYPPSIYTDMINKTYHELHS